MSAIIKNFQIKLTQRQAGQIRRQFHLACKKAGVPKAAMIAQPKTQFGRIGSIILNSSVLDCAVVTVELFEDISTVIEKHRKNKTDSPTG